MHLGLNSEGFYFLLSAASLSDKRKGVDWAIQLILKVKDLNPTILLMGHVDINIEESLKGFPVQKFGYVSSYAAPVT
jgi:hypothetical protein